MSPAFQLELGKILCILVLYTIKPPFHPTSNLLHHHNYLLAKLEKRKKAYKRMGYPFLVC